MDSEDMVTSETVTPDLTVRTHAYSTPQAGVVATFECTPRGLEWYALGDVSRGRQGLSISRLEVREGPESTGGGITGGTLQKIPVGHLLRIVRAQVDPALASPPPVADTPLVQRVREGGRVAMDDALLREIAYRYWTYTQPGAPRGAVKRMAVDFGRPEETIRTWVARARKDGWLGPSVKGRAGAEIGPKLKHMLELELAELSIPLAKGEWEARMKERDDPSSPR